MDKIEKIREWVKKQKKEELARNSIGVITGKAFFVDVDELLSFLDTLSEEPDKSLEEAAKQFVGYDMDTDDLRDYEVGIQAFKSGAEWQASQMPMPEDTVLFQKGVAEGRRLEREDMPKWRKIVGTGAPSGSIISYGRTHYLLHSDLDRLPKKD